MAKGRLEARIVRRSIPADKRSDTPWIEIVKISKSPAGLPYLHVRTNPGSDDRADVIFAKVHLVMSVRAGNAMEDFSTADETQNEALQFIEQFLADEEGFQSLEAERKADVSEKQIGPRRVELLVQERNPSRLPATQKRLVVTSLIEPSGNFRSYLLTGREWRSMEKRDLSKITSTMNSDAVDVLEVFIYDAGSIYTEEREPFSTEVAKQQTAWKRALREFGRLDEPEKVQLRYWDGMAGMSPAVVKPTTTHYPEVDPDFDAYA